MQDESKNKESDQRPSAFDQPSAFGEQNLNDRPSAFDDGIDSESPLMPQQQRLSREQQIAQDEVLAWTLAAQGDVGDVGNEGDGIYGPAAPPVAAPNQPPRRPPLVNSLSMARLVAPDEDPARQQELRRAEITREHDPRVFWAWSFFMAIKFGLGLGILIWTWNEPCNKNIHEWLVGYIVVLFIRWTLAAYSFYNFAQRRYSEYAAILVKFFSFIWWIYGQYLVYNSSPSECNAALWGTVLAFIILQTIGYCCLPILLCCMCCWLPVLQRFINISSVRSADQSEIDALETRSFDDNKESLEDVLGEKGKCTICYEEYKSSDQIRVLKCKHIFHAECVDEWLRINRTCPICRRDITGGDPPENNGVDPDIPPAEGEPPNDEQAESGPGPGPHSNLESGVSPASASDAKSND